MRNKFMMVILATLVATSSGFVLGQSPASAEPQNKRDAANGVSESQPKESAGKGELSTQTDKESGLKGAKASKEKSAHGDATSGDEAAITPYYNNFFDTYRLGPEDVISVSVFGQDRYSKSGIVIPPNGRISYPLIAEGVLVAGKTVEEIGAILTKRYDEYIIDPKITVSLDKAVSYRYSVVGDVAQPGVKLMGRRLTVTEALAEAGGVLPTGDKKKVLILRRSSTGNMESIPVNIAAIYKHRALDDKYLNPGDQVIVPGNRMKQLDKILGLLPILSFARIFTGTGY